MPSFSLRNTIAAAATAVSTGALGGCAVLPEPVVVMGSLQIDKAQIHPIVPDFYTLEKCLAQGQRMFDLYGRKDFDEASSADPSKPVTVIWRCNEWTHKAKGEFELRRTEHVVPDVGMP